MSRGKLKSHRYFGVFVVTLMTVLLMGEFNIPHTQAATTDAGNITNLTLTTSPEFPRANDTVTISAQSYSIDLNSSIIRWYVDGKLVQEKTGIKTLTINAGPSGSSKIIKVQAISSDGTVSERQISVAPTNISIIWQANTYTPPFYKGRRLYSVNSDITLVALTDSTVSSSELVYTWKDGSDVIPQSGGLGANIVTISGGLISRDRTYSVDAVSADGKYRGHAELYIAPILPQVLIYEDNPIYGIRYEKALQGSETVATNEVKLSSYPFYFSTENRLLTDLSYKWTVTGQNGVAGNKSSVIINTDGNVSNVNLSLAVKSPSKLFQSNTQTLKLLFSK